MTDKCETHEKRIMFYCLDPRCKKNPICCILCVKNDHPTCKDEFMVEKDDAKSRINLVKNESDPTIITKKLNQVMELKLYEMNKSLMQKKKGFIESFDIQESPDNILDPNVLQNVKKNFNFEFDQDTNLINISSKFNATEEQVDESLTAFEKDLEKKLLSFLDNFSKLKFTIRNNNMSADDWIGHANLAIEDIPEGVHFERKPEDQAFNYFCSMYTLPLDQPCTFKVNVEAVYESDRFVDVGIMPKSKYDTTKNGFVNSFSSGGSISFCGYSHGGGLTGKTLTSGSSDVNGMKSGSHFYMRYEPGVEVRFYNDEDTLDLKKSMTGIEEEYYLFAVCYHPQVKYYIERID